MSTNGPLVGFVKVRAVVVFGMEGAGRRYYHQGAIGRKSFNAYYAGAKTAEPDREPIPIKTGKSG